MTHDLLIGIALGLGLGGLLWLADRWLYRRILIQCAQLGTPELLDGGYYYIVPESEYL